MEKGSCSSRSLLLATAGSEPTQEPPEETGMLIPGKSELTPERLNPI